MSLDIFNDLINNIKQNSLANDLIKELKEFIENRNTRNQISLLDQMQNEEQITSKYRDKMLVERNNILKDYANETSEQGTMYYIYRKNNSKYFVSICEEGKSHEIIEIEEKNLPKTAGVDSVLRLENGKFILDEQATKTVQEKMKEKFSELLKNQQEELETKRIEGHSYEVTEKSENRIWLIDKDSPKNEDKTAFEVFEEIAFSKEQINEIEEGEELQYINGEYKKI